MLKIKNILVACVLSLPIYIPAQATPDYDYFSEVLQLKSRWARLSTKTINKYLLYLERKGLYNNITPDAKNQVKEEILAELKNRLTWDKVGERVAAKVISGCSDETLRNFAEAYQGRGTETDVSVASKYLKCASNGVDQSLVIIQEEFKRASPSLSLIAERYRKKRIP